MGIIKVKIFPKRTYFFVIVNSVLSIFDKNDKCIYMQAVLKITEVRNMSEFVVIKVLTSPTCPYCPQAVRMVKEIASRDPGVIAIELSVTTPQGYEEAVKFGISGVPAIIINDQRVIHGLPSYDALMREIEFVRR